MAGKRQHYLPRLLQRGFLAEPLGGAERTWLHRPGMPARLVGIRDVGVEDWFYSRKAIDEEPTLDDAITEYERDLSKNVAILRGATPGSDVDAPIAAETVVHLVLRAAHIRRLTISSVTSATDAIGSLFTDPVRLGAMIGVNGPAMSSAVTDAIAENAVKLVPAGLPSALTERLFTFLVREVGDELVSQATAALGPLLPMLLDGLNDKVRDMHTAILERPIDETGWALALQELDWSVEAATDLILPDAVAFSQAEGRALDPLLFTTAADTIVVLMPVAHDRMLVGRRGGATADLSLFNERAAAGCEAFFIAARPCDDDLVSRIGTGPAMALDESIGASIREAEKVRSLSTVDLPPARPREIQHADFSFRVTLADFGDDVLAKEYAGILQSVISALARDLPLETLDAITIAVDYERALASLDRGDPALPPASSGALGYGIGVAKPVAVVRDGQPKQHLVLAASLADGWTSPDEAIRGSSVYILVSMLAGIAEAARYGDGYATQFTPDPVGRELHEAVARAPSGYWSAKRAAFVHPDEGARFMELVIDGLDHAEREIAAERHKMVDSTDIDGPVTRAISCIAAVLSHAADWLGHRDGLADGQPFSGSDLPDRLRDRGLDRWLVLFGRDLASCYPADGTLDLVTVTSLGGHVERLLWSFGIYCWPDNDKMLCVVSNQPLGPLSLGDSMCGPANAGGS